VSIRNLSWGILELDRMGEFRKKIGKFIEMHLYPKSTPTSAIFEWF
jgi:hypothetical protein